MSLVGPRCYLPGEIPDMGGQEDLGLKVKPGITGFWQVSGRNRTTFVERVEMDVYYIRNWSVAFDLYILYETVWRSEEHTSELQSLMRISYAVFCLKKKKDRKHI